MLHRNQHGQSGTLSLQQLLGTTVRIERIRLVKSFLETANTLEHIPGLQALLCTGQPLLGFF